MHSGSTSRSRKDKRRSAWSYLNQYSLVVALLVVIGLFSYLRPRSFATTVNAGSILTGSAPLALIALGLMLPLVVNQFDLSAGFMATFAGLLVVGLIVNSGVAVVLGGNSCPRHMHRDRSDQRRRHCLRRTGFAHRHAGSRLRSSSGPVSCMPHNTTIFMRNRGLFQELGQTRLWGFVGLPFVYMAAIAIALWYVLEYRPLGRRLYAIGGSEEGARLVGIPVKRMTVLVFVASAFLAALGGVVQATRVGSANPTGVSALLLPAFTAAFLGATSIRPGHYNVWGTVIAVYLVAAATTGMIMLGAPASVSDIFNGSILVAAVGLAMISSRRSAET